MIIQKLKNIIDVLKGKRKFVRIITLSSMENIGNLGYIFIDKNRPELSNAKDIIFKTLDDKFLAFIEEENVYMVSFPEIKDKNYKIKVYYNKKI